jgi:dCMP deaminase
MNIKTVLNWDEYFACLAILTSYRSKDPSTQVGCCIVDENNKIKSLGYNGFPNTRNQNDNNFPWGKTDEEPLNTKYPYVVHAELNAILNYKGDLSGCSLYTTLYPCNECAKAIIQSGIKKVYYLDKKKSNHLDIASERMFHAAEVLVTKLDLSNLIFLLMERDEFKNIEESH